MPTTPAADGASSNVTTHAITQFGRFLESGADVDYHRRVIYDQGFGIVAASSSPFF